MHVHDAGAVVEDVHLRIAAVNAAVAAAVAATSVATAAKPAAAEPAAEPTATEPAARCSYCIASSTQPATKSEPAAGWPEPGGPDA